MLSEDDHTGSGERAAMPADLGKDSNQPRPSEDRVEQTTTAHIQCSVCGTAFRRPEHLKRHLRSHTKEKPFECAQCGRHFSRSDTLHRHELSHHTPGEGGNDRTHRITVKTFRACFSCATARVRCSGGVPCGRCETRSLECQYPTKRRSKAKLRNETVPGPSTAEMHEQKLQNVQGFSPRLSVDHAASHQIISFSVSGMSEPRPLTTGAHHSSERKASITRASDIRPRGGSSGTGPVTASTSANHLQPHNTMPNLNLDMSSSGVGRGTVATLDFGHAPFDHNMLSTLNWLPDEFLPVTSHGEAQRGFESDWAQSAGTKNHATRMPWQLSSVQNGQASPSIPESVSLMSAQHLSPGTEFRNHRRYSHVTGEASDQDRPAGSGKRPADYSGNQDGVHYSKILNSQVYWSTPGANGSSEHTTDESYVHHYAFPSVHGLHIGDNPSRFIHSVRPIEAFTHNEIYRNFLGLCRKDNPFFNKFESETFPSVDECNWYLVCYFRSFQAVYPLLHLPSFDTNRCHWILTLAIVAIGCHYSKAREAEQCTAAFHEFTRRAIFCEKEKSRHIRPSLDIVQAMLFNCIGLLHVEDEGSQLAALGTFKDLVTLSSRESLLASASNSDLRGPSEESMWMAWVQGESRRRTGYCIWLLDCSLAYYFDNRPLLSLDDGQAPLPAHEDLWQARDAQTWRQLWNHSSVNESLYHAVHILYIEKRLVTGIGDFSHILLIHALYHRMWEVGDYFRRPLSFWNPTAKKQPRDTAIPTGSVWLPGIPSYSKWRNSACDCLDILDWKTNDTISKAAGLEPPTVLHLHAARVLLLAPFREIRSLVTSLTTGELQWSQREEVLEWQYIWRWVKHDQYKARLSIVHAGATLWHVQRFSTSAIHGPVTVFLAVLILWAYGSCGAWNSQTSSPHDETSRLPPLRESSSIQLDRPCDDKSVQLFVREGHAMRGNLTGVGDICARGAPEKVLLLGCEVLSNLTAWGLSKRFVDILTRLADVMRRFSDVETDRRIEHNGC